MQSPEITHTSHTSREVHFSPFTRVSLRGTRSKRKGKVIRARDNVRGMREEGNACKEAIVFAIPPTD